MQLECMGFKLSEEDKSGDLIERVQDQGYALMHGTFLGSSDFRFHLCSMQMCS